VRRQGRATGLAATWAVAVLAAALAIEQPDRAEGQGFRLPSVEGGFSSGRMPAPPLFDSPMMLSQAQATEAAPELFDGNELFDDDLVPDGSDPGASPPPLFLDSDPGLAADCWHWQLLPDGLIYRSYLAGVKEPRFAVQWVDERSRGSFYDIALGGRVGIVRYGTWDPRRPEGWQLDFEGAVFPRIESGSLDVISMDFRYGIPLTYGRGPYRMKLAFYHLSAHLADEFLVNHPGARRLNYLRDAIVWGHSFYPTEDLRLYAEAAYSFRVDDGAEPWEFQFGVDYSPAAPSGFWPVPFIAVGGHLREEVEFGGHVVVQVGVQWRGASGNLFRIGMHYFNGKSDQYEFFDRFESKIGAGMWYDY